jgi:hypothetical protein
MGGLGHNVEDLVDLAAGEVALGLASGDDQVRHQFHLAQEVSVLEGHVELVIQVITSSMAGAHSTTIVRANSVHRCLVVARTGEEQAPSLTRVRS